VPVAELQWECSASEPLPDAGERHDYEALRSFEGCGTRLVRLSGRTWTKDWRPVRLEEEACADDQAAAPAARGGGGCAVELRIIEDVHSSGPGGRIWDAGGRKQAPAGLEPLRP
jgi:hypothetical protein